jgi:signal transduction histidine kinase
MRLWSLRAKIALFVTLIVAITLALSGFMIHRWFARTVRHATQEHIDALALATRNSIIEAMATQCIDIDNILESLSQHEDIVSSRIFNIDGVIHHSTNPGELGEAVNSAALESFRQGRQRVVIDGWEGEERILCLVYPIENGPRCHRCHDRGQKINGVLNLDASMTHLEQDLATGRLHLLITILVTLMVLVLGITWMLGRVVTRPVDGLVGAMRQAEGGSLDVRAKIGRKDEFGLMADSFNSMVERLQEARKQVEELHRADMRRADRLAVTGELAASLAHEIRNPLAGISGAVEALARGVSEDDPKNKITKEILRQIERVNTALNNLLSFTRPAEPELKKTLLNEEVKKTLFFALQQKEVSKTKVSLDLARDLPHTLVDQQQMEQVFLNIILNALQAMHGGGKLSVKTSVIRAAGGGQLIRTEISDTGEGIPPELMEKLFRPFFTTKVKGTGLGLAISRDIVEQHGGKISIRSRTGVGSSFMIDIPVRTS